MVAGGVVEVWLVYGCSFSTTLIEVPLDLDFWGFDQHLDPPMFEKHVRPPVVDQHAMGFLVFE